MEVDGHRILRDPFTNIRDHEGSAGQVSPSCEGDTDHSRDHPIYFDLPAYKLAGRMPRPEWILGGAFF